MEQPGQTNMLEIRTTRPTSIECASLSVPMRVWQMAGLCSDSVRQAAINNWMMLGVYFTQTFLFKMKKVRSPLCLGCNKKNEDLSHFLLHCDFFAPIRENFLPKFITQNKYISDILNSEELVILSIIDPVSSKLPENVRKNWLSVTESFKISREFCHNMHKKREKLYKELNNVT